MIAPPFSPIKVQTSDAEVTIVGQRAGNEHQLLLLHGNPLTHLSWQRIAPRLAQDFTVVATDLRGYGDSSKPRGRPDHSNYSFRRMAQDQVEVMRSLGFEQFFVAGHDRGARTAFRMALDHPDRVLKAAFLDILPTYHVWTDVSMAWAINSYHWMFMAQPYDFPERLLRGNEEYYIRNKLTKQGLGKGGFTEEEIREYVRVCTPENIHGVAKTTVPPRASISRWTAPISTPGEKSPARRSYSGASSATPASTTARRRYGRAIARTSCACRPCRAGTILPSRRRRIRTASCTASSSPDASLALGWPTRRRRALAAGKSPNNHAREHHLHVEPAHGSRNYVSSGCFTRQP